MPRTALSRSRRFVLVVGAVALTVGLGACGDDDNDSDEATPTNSSTVTVETFTFEPDPLTVPAGTTVTFTNEDSINHSVTPGARDEPTPDRFDEGVMSGQGDTYELTLDEPGTYDYFCKFHDREGMTAQIIVE